ncbi:MAG TPA: M28 family peptidase, partial [Pyrinomonadaceae bacterium]|nr:M28 family peptidase [Pyrinomonadaceae bacterium]
MRRFLAILIMISALMMPLPASYAQRRSGKTTTAQAAVSSSTRGAEQITAAQLKDYLYFIASDEMEGRDTPSRGLDLTAKFIAMNLSRWGIKPGGDDGTYFQRISLRRYKQNPAEARVQIGAQNFKLGEDFHSPMNFSRISATLAGNTTGPLVYVGNGWVVKSKNMDAYQGVDVRDKVMVIAGMGIPKGVGREDLRGRRGEDWVDPQTYARVNGAKGIIVVQGPQSQVSWDSSSQTIVERSSVVVEKFQQPGDESRVPMIVASQSMAQALFDGEKQYASETSAGSMTAGAGVAFDLSPNKKVTINLGITTEQVGTQNVIGVLEGSDPALKNEYVAIGAHYDHVGIGAPVNGDAIYNGADDDGSGTTAVLAMAEAFARGPRPKRSILFVWHAGEEKGLWGSRYFTEYPTVPLERIVTQINIDMIGRSKKAGDTNQANRELTGPHEIYVIGSKMMSTELGELSERVNKSYFNLSFNYRYDNPHDPNRFFFRSDHFNYARKGIPII